MYIFLVLSFIALGILGYFVFNNPNQNVMVGSRKFVTFNSVKNATCYSVEVSNEDKTDTENALYTVDKQQIDGQDNAFKYNVNVEVNNKKVAEESYEQEILNQNNLTNKIDCTIKNYKVNFFDEDGETITKTLTYENQTLKDFDTNKFCLVVSDYFDDLFKQDGTFYVKCTACNDEGEIIGDNGEPISQLITYDYKAYYKDDFLRRDKFYYNGVWYDYVIESKEELNNLVWRTILYRGGKEGETFYIDCPDINSGNINALVFNAIDLYPEYNGLNYNKIFATMTGNVGTLINFDYYLDENFTKTYQDLSNLNNGIYQQALMSKNTKFNQFAIEYINNSDTSKREFYINSDNIQDEVVVYNTEQLFMVVQSGARPKFVDGKSDIAKIVYENAFIVLEQINKSNALTNYEKALNIYRYLTSEIMYDWVTYDYMALTNDFSIKNFGNYSCFYLEGVFYNFDGLDCHYAVCDGLSKAFSLMCNIEGINCFKINGEIINQGNHAWNKLYLSAEEEYNLEDGWYYVDVTWGEGRISRENKQYLTHSYFLFQQDENERLIEYPKNTEQENPSKTYDYYKNVYYTITTLQGEEQVDCYIENDNNFEKILKIAYEKYLATNSSYAIEVKLDSGYLNSTNNLYYEFLMTSQDMSKRILFASQHGIGTNWNWIRGDNILIIYFS